MPEISAEIFENAKSQGSLAVCDLIGKAVLESVGGTLDADTMPRLNASQITLIAYRALRREVLEGGFIQLIHNGYGPFIFLNPFAKAMRLWGCHDLCDMLYNVRRLYEKTKDAIEADCTDEQFMALYERYESYDEYDDEFVERENEFTQVVADHVINNISEFAIIK